MKRNLLFSGVILATAAFTVNAERVAVSQVQQDPVARAVASQQVSQISAAKFSNAPKVVASKNGVSLVEVNGRLVKVLNKGAKLGSVVKKADKKIQLTAASTFFEGFESYDGKSSDWIPANWQDVSKTNPPHVAPSDPKATNLTWETWPASTYSSPSEGKYFAHIQVSIPDFTADPIVLEEAQDEWLISPAVTPKQGDYLTFDLSYSPCWTLLNATTMTFDAVNNILEVQISEDNGTTWTKVWDVLEDAKSYTEEELNRDGASYVHPYVPFLIDLKNYVGKSIKIAFRYVGQSGESMALDNINVGPATPVASYTIPLSHQYWAFSSSGTGYPFTHLAPVGKSTYSNTSDFGKTYEWAYESLENGTDVMYSQEKDLTLDYTPGWQFYYPTLTATLDGNSSSYQYGAFTTSQGQTAKGFVQIGGEAEGSAALGYLGTVAGYNPYYTTPIYLGLMSTDVTAKELNSAFGRKDVASVVGPAILLSTYGVDYVLKALNTEIPKSSLVNVDNNTVLTATAYQIEQGVMGKVLGTATTTIGASELSADGNSYAASFGFKQKVGAITKNAPITVNGDVLIVFSAEKSGVGYAIRSAMYPEASIEESVVDYINTYIIAKNAEGKTLYMNGNNLGGELTYTDGTSAGVYYVAGLDVKLEGYFNWLSNATNNNESWANDEEGKGGTATFYLDSYSQPDEIKVEGEGLDDWFTYETGEKEVITQGGKEYLTDIFSIKFTFDALPAGTNGRRSIISVTVPGAAPVQFGIGQGSAGVSSVETSANKVVVAGGDFVVTAANAGLVEVYNAAGQKVAEAEVDGTATVPASGLAKGLYLVKFADNTVVKVVK